MATVHGGTKLCIEGKNLGLGKSDIMEFLLCGSDLLDTIEFESENRIYVTTKPNTPGKGDLWIETVSGGQNVIKNVFTFVDRSAEKTGSLERQIPPAPAVIPPSPERDVPQQPSPLPTRVIPTLKIEGELRVQDKVISSSEHNLSLHRSSSQQEKSTTLLGSTTLPRVKSSCSMLTEHDREQQSDNGGRFRKNYQKHTRGASESIVAIQRDADGRTSASEKADLQKEIVRLMKENEEFIDTSRLLSVTDKNILISGLRRDNADLHTYIEKLVSRVLEKCPEVLAADDGLKMPTKK
ncbi:hypothetical protein C0Q70_00387 [Pomacea canaliculata]|uniref:IPT/TIG domain-containing protein n=1 Tax=Pomacea canaliculata TaxID=400727 RepID=A0A2T7PWH6_POMCA|nr:hypothetical protein C0Q70_00387 [Pomacea canaliculata]